MIGTKATLHVAFNLSIACSIRKTLQASGCDVHVIGLADDLSFGPIDAPTSQARAEWVGDVVGFEWSEVVQKSGIFWHELKSSCASLVAWVNLNDSSDYCGLLEFIHVIDQTPFMVIDATEVEFTNRQSQKYISRSLGIVPPEQMLQAGLLGRAQQPDLDKIEKYRCTWAKLKDENAPLRIVNQRSLISAHIDYFDAWIVRHTTDEWKKGALVVSEALCGLFRSEESPHVGDIWLWGRVRSLAEEGILETVGNTLEMQKTMVRRSFSYQRTIA